MLILLKNNCNLNDYLTIAPIDQINTCELEAIKI